jgi:hypothetical protein
MLYSSRLKALGLLLGFLLVLGAFYLIARHDPISNIGDSLRAIDAPETRSSSPDALPPIDAVRSQVEQESGAHESFDLEPPAPSLGRISEEQKIALLESWESAVANMAAELAKPSDGDPLERELRDARLLWQIDKRLAATEIIRRNGYVTFDGSAPPLPTGDQYEPISRSEAGTVHGKVVGLVVYVPVNDKNFAESNARYQVAYDSYWGARAARFNALSVEERAHKVQLHDEALRKLQEFRHSSGSTPSASEVRAMKADLLNQGPLSLDRQAFMLIIY